MGSKKCKCKDGGFGCVEVAGPTGFCTYCADAHNNEGTTDEGQTDGE